MNGLAIGQAVPENLATWNPLGCRTEANASVFAEYPEDDPIWNAFIPTFPAEQRGSSGSTYEVYPFDVHHNDDRTLRWLRINSSTISSDRGIHVGSSDEEVRAAYPDAAIFESNPYRSYNIDAGGSRLVIEVTERGFEGGAPQEVWTMYLTSTEWDLGSLGGRDGGFFCALTI